jgi:preprotein translocase subunit SecF
MNIIEKRYWFFALSLLIIIPGLIALLLGGLRPSIDFTGGTILEVHFAPGVSPAPDAIRSVITNVIIESDQKPLGTVQVQSTASGNASGATIRLRELDQTDIAKVLTVLRAQFGEVTVDLADKVGASVGAEVATRAALAVAVASLAIALYVTYAFRNVPNAFRYGVAAIIAMLHDVLVLIGVEAIIGLVLGWEADALFLTAVLTVIGFSVHDTIVVFDRIRENRVKYRSTNYEKVVNHSVVQTMDRSINTTLTVLLTLLALAIFGGVTTQHFIIILLVGMASGAYSSIFNAAAILVVWENREWKNWFRRRQTA